MNNAKQIHDAASAQRILVLVLRLADERRNPHITDGAMNRAARGRLIESARCVANERLADLAGTFSEGSPEFRRAADQARAAYDDNIDTSTLLRRANEWDALVDNDKETT